MELEGEGADVRFIVTVEDVSGKWSSIRSALESKASLRHFKLRNKFGNPVDVEELSIKYLLPSDDRLKRLRRHGQNPVTWFRNPYVQLLVVSGDDVDDYKRVLKSQLRSLLDREKDPLGMLAPEYVIAYVNPSAGGSGLDTLSKGAKKVLDSVKHDLARKSNRCVRLDVGPRGAVPQSQLGELDRQLADALRGTFEARRTAYDDEVRRLTLRRQEKGWTFSTLFLVKDSLAMMLEAATLLDDALREYAELEALFLETLPAAGGPEMVFGGTAAGDDIAQLLRATWRGTRRSVQRNGIVQFDFQQFLFACQARILLKQQRAAEVADRGLAFVRSFSALLSQQTAAGRLPRLFQEAWAFSACVALAKETVRMGPPPPTPVARTPLPPRHPSLPPHAPGGLHRRSTSEMPRNAANPGHNPRLNRHARSLSANHFGAIAEDSAGSEGASNSTANSERAESEQDEEDGDAGPLHPESRQESMESATREHRKSLRPLRTGRSNVTGLEGPGGIANGRPPGSRPAQQPKSRRQSGGGGPPGWQPAPPDLRPAMNWQLGIPGELHGDFLEEATPGPWAVTEAGRLQAESPSERAREFWCQLGHIYALARDQFECLGSGCDLASSLSSTPRHDSLKSNDTSATAAVPESPDYFQSGHMVARAEAPAASLGARAPSPPPLSTASLAAMESTASQSKVDGTVGSELRGGSLDTAMEARQVHHARRLSRFGVEASPRRSDSVNSLLPPTNAHSRRSSVSVSEYSATGQSDDGSGLIRRASDPDIVRPEADLRNIQQVEREVETASEDSGSPASAIGAGSTDGSEGVRRQLPWLTEWRLRSALSSVDRYQELYKELSGAAAASYTAAGYRRTGERMLERVADVLAQRGARFEAAAMVQRQARQFLAAGWLCLAAPLLLKLMAYHLDLYQAVMPSVCLRYLSLPDRLRGASEAADTQEALVAAALEPAVPHPSLPLPGIEVADGSLSGLCALWFEPLPGLSSRFFGQSKEDGEPITTPSYGAGTECSGAKDVCVGDIVRVPVSVVSRLPQALSVIKTQLILSIVQEMTVLVSERGSRDNALTRGNGHLRAASMLSLAVDSPLAHNEHAVRPASMGGHADASGHRRTASSAKGEGHRQQGSLGAEVATPGMAMSSQDTQFAIRWQETEEVACQLVAQGQHGEVAAAPGAQVVLQPGRNVLWFQLTPLRRGLYVLKRVNLALGRLKLQLAPVLPRMEAAELEAWSSKAGAARPKTPLGSADSAGRLGEEAILCKVDLAAQRVGVSAVAADAMLTSGLSQWLGIALCPLHDVLSSAFVHIQPVIESEGHVRSGPIPLDIDSSRTPWISPLADDTVCRKPGEAVGDGVTANAPRGPAETDNGEPSTSSWPQEHEWQHGAGPSGPLPGWLAQRPGIIWLWVHPGELAAQQEVVRVTPWGSQTPLRTPGKELPGSPSRSPSGLANDLMPWPRGAVELDVHLDYRAGCQRGHSTRISVPVSPPFRIRVCGKELAGQRVLLQILLTSCLSQTLTINSLTVNPQPGFDCEAQPQELTSLLPLRIAPHASASLLCFLGVVNDRAVSGRSRNRLSSSLEIAYRLAAPGSQRAGQPLQEVACEWNPRLLQGRALPAPPSQSADLEEKEAVQRHGFVLDLGSARSAPRSTVYVRLLGPFSARAGEAVTFCWRLERSQAFAAEQEASALQYEVRAEGEGWRPSGTRTGTIKLPLEGGGSATVEATWLAAVPGMLPIPQLRLPDVPHQEVFDVGVSNDLINVL